MQLYLNGRAAEISDYAQDDLARAVINSLFSWARAEDDDDLPGNSRFGWWADTFADEEDSSLGSRLWLLSRSKLTDEVLRQAEEYAQESLEWLLEDGVARSVAVQAEKESPDRLNLSVEILKPDGTSLNARFNHVWER